MPKWALLLLVAWWIAVPPTAHAVTTQDPNAAIADILRTGVYLEPDAGGTRAGLEATVVASDGRVAAAILADDVTDFDSLADFGNEVFAAIGSPVTALYLVSPIDVTVRFDQQLLSAADVDRALDAAMPALERNDIDDSFAAFANALPLGAAAPAPIEPTTESTANDAASSGVPGWFWLLVLAVPLVGIAIWFIVRRRQKSERLELTMEAARGELREETSAAADLIFELADRITTADPEVQQLFDEASNTFREVGEQAETAETPTEMSELIRRLAYATWQFEVVEARLEGRTPPPQPSPQQMDVPIREEPPPPAPGQPAPPAGRPPPVPPVLQRTRRRRQSGLWDILGPAIGGMAGGAIFRRNQPRRRRARPRRGGGSIFGAGSGQRRVSVDQANRGSSRSSRPKRSSGSRSRRRSRSSGSTSRRRR